MKKTAVFVMERQTKGAVLYREINPKTLVPLSMSNAVCGNIYVRKSSIDEGQPPQYISVTIEEVTI